MAGRVIFNCYTTGGDRKYKIVSPATDRILCDINRAKPIIRIGEMQIDFDLRNTDIEQRYLKGETLEIIGQAWGITRERVRQILVKRAVNPKAGGAALMRRLAPPKVKISKRPVYPEGLRKCLKCGTLDKLENFYKIKRKGGGVTYLHKPCRDEYMRDYLKKRRPMENE